MFTPILPAPSQQPPAPHQYETRIRSNSAIRPSARLRQSPDAPHPTRRVRPLPGSKPSKQTASGSISQVPQSAWPSFPPANVVLHPDDASNKVFLALGRALIAVDNRAMTVKDLSEMGMKYGLMCQNLSAAGQAITTFIRNHLQRCDTQQDQPLLLRHVMSGTSSDDDLVGALYSRVGGAHCTNAEGEGRMTNFRRGTMVWYLSKAAGAPCPFARAGISLCDYNENGKVGMPINTGREKKRERDRMRKTAQSAGQKRKRLLRSCADKVPGSVSDSSDEEEKRPPKVKLTLRLKPGLASRSPSESVASGSRACSAQPDSLLGDDGAESEESDSDSMSVDSDGEDSPTFSSPSYSRPSIPASTSCRPSLPDLPPPPFGFPLRPEACRRSSSVPYSVFSESPPPESDDDDEFHSYLSASQRPFGGRPHSFFEDEEDSSWEDDFFGDFDVDNETQWESPGPRSPSVQIADDVVVKQEPTDVRGFLDAWDDLESRATELKVIDVVAQAAAAERQAQHSTSDDFASWSWPDAQSGTLDHIKQEDIETSLFFSEHDPTPPPEVLSPIIPFDPCESPVEECPLRLYKSGLFESQWRDVEILGPDSVKPRDLDDGAWHEYRGTRAVSPDERVHSPSPEPSNGAVASPSSSPKVSRCALAPLDVRSPDMVTPAAQRNLSITSPTLIASLTSLSLQAPVSAPSTSSPPVAPERVEETSLSDRPAEADPLVVHTILPSQPAISATLFEGVCVYQMVIGSSTFLRRIDTDFVNGSPIARHLKTVCSTAANAVTITAGSSPICGTWLPLCVAQEMSGGHSDFDVFLSDDLRALFPEAISALGPVDGRQAASASFGHQFQSASDARRQSMTSHRLELPPREFEPSWDDHLSTHPSFILATAAIQRPAIDEEPTPVETPLSPSEEEMFRVLCAAPEWESTGEEPAVVDAKGVTAAPVCPSSVEASENGQERPLRRSKRVANAVAVATRSRTRSSRRGSRTSLS